MFEKLNSPQEIFTWQLGAALTMERDIVETLDELIEEANSEELKQALRSHQGETRRHVTNVEEAFRAIGCEVDDAPCPAIQALAKEGKANIKKTDEALVDNVILGAVIETEHHEIGVYEKLITLARALGHQGAVQLLQSNCDDEQQTLQKAKALAERVAAATPAHV